MAAPPTVDTGKVTDRRKLSFRSVDDVLADVERIIAAERAGKLRCTGNWTAGQVFGHLASWTSFPYEGFPMGPPPWFIRFILRRVMKKKYLRDGMRPGVWIPRAKEGTWATEPMSCEEGAARLRQAFMRLKNREPAKFDSPAFGPMSDDERIALNLRHAELHLGFLHP